MSLRDVVFLMLGMLLGAAACWLFLRSRVCLLRSCVARLTMHYRHERTLRRAREEVADA